MPKALVDIDAEPMGLEFCAALYESYVADYDAMASYDRSVQHYAHAANRLVERIEMEWWYEQ